MKKFLPHNLQRAFSLVEVVLALGLVSFCLLAIVGLLPVGLRSVKNANEESAAANALNQMASAIRNATTTDGITYLANGAFTEMAWNMDGATKSFTQALALSGQPDAANVRLQGHVILIAPASSTSPGRAQISVAWPASATWSGGQWTKADGSISSGIIFIPRQ